MEDTIVNLFDESWFLCGIEKEGLRTTPTGHLSSSPHPRSLGSKIAHPYITTDFGESQLELITSPWDNVKDAFNQLIEIHSYIYYCIEDEFFWPSSMPCILPKDDQIRIANFGSSFIGKAKELYRIGLSHRYGRSMQTVSGVHFNFSFSNRFLAKLAQTRNSKFNQKFIDAVYFNLIRNYRRYSFVINLLFGASPSFDQSFMDNSRQAKKEDYKLVGNTWLSNATSLRMSSIGYMSSVQNSIRLCFDCLDDYITSIREALEIPIAEFSAIGITDKQGNFLQLNDNLLQIENEYYSQIRPKRITNPWTRPVVALEQQGIEYIEIRNIDLDPYQPYGIDENRANFMVLFLLWCLLEDSPAISKEECNDIQELLQQVTMNGLELFYSADKSTTKLHTQVQEVLNRIEPTAKLLEKIGQPQYLQALQHIKKAPLPAQKIREASKQIGFTEHLISLAHEHKRQIPKPSKEVIEKFQALASQSYQQQWQQEQRDEDSGQSFYQFLQDYLRL